jgi:hypothetical protein
MRTTVARPANSFGCWRVLRCYDTPLSRVRKGTGKHMTRHMLSGLVAVAAIGASMTGRVSASDPIGVYAIVDKAVVEPATGTPERIQIWGAFAMAQPDDPDQYGAARRGYLYFSCPKGQEQVCRSEWSDVQSVAGKGTGIGLGARRANNGRIRSLDEKPASPDTYPIHMGVVRVTGRGGQTEVVNRLKAAPRGK